MSFTTFRRWLPRLAVTVVFLGALVLLSMELEALTVAGIVGAVASVAPRGVVLSLVLTGIAFGALVGSEALAVRRAGAPVVAPARVGWAAFLGYAFTQALGSPLFGRPPVRRRMYMGWGMDPERVEGAVRAGRATLLLGPPVLLGWALLGLPGISLTWVEGMVGGVGRPVGAWRALLALAGAGLLVPVAVWVARTGPWSLARLGASLAYWAASAGALAVLLPAEAVPGGFFGGFLAAFVVAHAAGLLSRVPAGLGVFEVVFFALLPEGAVTATALVAVVAFRLVYGVAPLLVASTAIAVHESGHRRESMGRALSALGSGLSGAVPVILSGTVFLAGAVLLLTGALPLGRAPDRLPLPVLEISHFLGSVVGTGLLILAWGLARRIDAAFKAALALLALGSVLAGLRGGGWGAAAILLLVLVLLLPARKEFFRPSALTWEPLSPDWVLGVVVVLGATLWLGIFAHRDVALSGDLWWEFAFRGDASRFLRASVGAGAVLAVFAGIRLFRTPEPEDPEIREFPPQVEEVVASSPRPSANLVWLGDKRILLSGDGRAFIMYGVEGRSWVSMGDPVGDPDGFPELIWLFRSKTFGHGGWPVFYQVAPDYLPLYVDAGLGLLKLGEEAVVDVQAFGLEGGARAGMRKAVRKVEKDGISFRVLPPAEVARELPRLREVSEAWLQEKDAREKGFSLGTFEESYVARFPHAVAFREDRIVAFGNLWLGGDGEAFSLDLMRYDPARSPAGVMQYLFARALLWGREEGFRRFSLGMAPLSGLESGRQAPFSARLGSALYRHGEHFYNFQGLRAYKEKFDPAWEPRYLASPGGLALPRILGNLAALVSGGVRGVLGR